MKVCNEKAIENLTDEELLHHYEKTCISVDSVFGIHPLSHTYTGVHNDLQEEILKRMKK